MTIDSAASSIDRTHATPVGPVARQSVRLSVCLSVMSNARVVYGPKSNTTNLSTIHTGEYILGLLLCSIVVILLAQKQFVDSAGISAILLTTTSLLSTTTVPTRCWHVTISCQPDGRSPQPVRPWKSGRVHLAEGSNV